jgi:RNA polymerase sporulation-specific sigma factor
MTNRNKVIENNLGLVHTCCKRFKGKGIEYDDLYMAGCLGLVKAVDKFDETKGFCLSTYAVPVILGEIKGLFRQNGTVKIARSIKELYLKITKLTGNDDNISIHTLSEKLNTSEERIIEALNAGKLPISLTTEEGSQLEISVNSCEEDFTEKLSLKTALESLNETDKNLINLRYYKHMTQTQTGKILNMSQVQVSRREKIILQKIRNLMTC